MNHPAHVEEVRPPTPGARHSMAAPGPTRAEICVHIPAWPAEVLAPVAADEAMSETESSEPALAPAVVDVEMGAAEPSEPIFDPEAEEQDMLGKEVGLVTADELQELLGTVDIVAQDLEMPADGLCLSYAMAALKSPGYWATRPHKEGGWATDAKQLQAREREQRGPRKQSSAT